MSDVWKPTDRPTDEHPHHHHHHHHRTIGVGKLHIPPHVETHAGISHTSEQLARVEDKVDAFEDKLEALFEFVRAHLSGAGDRNSPSN